MIAGIDLGTTNSAISIWQEQRVVLIPNALGETLTPSAVSLSKSGRILVGKPALEQSVTSPECTITEFKRFMGTEKRFRLAQDDYRPEMVASLILKSLKKDAEIYTGQPLEEAIITVPAYFNDLQRKAVRMAGELAGFKVRRLLNEPTAAALAYHESAESIEAIEGTFLVFDLGGGTFDVSIVEIFEGVVDVRASCGDNFLGGEDFVSLLFNHMVNKHGLLNLSPQQINKIRRKLEIGKRALSDQDSVTLQFQDDSLKVTDWEITRGTFESLATPLLERITHPLKVAIRDARIQPNSLDGVVMVGGATRKPMIRNLIARIFGRFPHTSIDPDLAVVHGAGVLTGMIANKQGIQERVLADVCPYSLGIGIARQLSGSMYKPGFFLPIIERNTSVPTSRVESITTVQDGQNELHVEIFQGEGRKTQDNIKLAEIRTPIPPKPAGEESVEVRFSYDVNGLLEVDTKVQSSGETKRILVQRHEGLMSDADMQAALTLLGGLKIHPREDLVNQAVLSRANRLYAEFNRDRRAYLDEHILAFEGVLESQDPVLCNQAREKLVALLDQLED